MIFIEILKKKKILYGYQAYWRDRSFRTKISKKNVLHCHHSLFAIQHEPYDFLELFKGQIIPFSSGPLNSYYRGDSIREN